MNTRVKRLAWVFSLIGSLSLMTGCASTGSLTGLVQAVAPIFGPKAEAAINRTINSARPALRQMEQAQAAQEAQAARQEQEAIDAMTPQQRKEYLAAKRQNEAAQNAIRGKLAEGFIDWMINGGGGSGGGGCPAGYHQEGDQCVTYRQGGGGVSSPAPAPAPAPVAPIHPNYGSCHSQMGC